MKAKTIGLVCLICLFQSGATVEVGKQKKIHFKKNEEAKISQKLTEMENDDASLSDMFAFSKAVSTGKSADEIVSEEEKQAREYAEL